MGAANSSTRKLTVDAMALLAMLEPNEQERERKHNVQALIETLLKQRWPSIRVVPFGSSASRLDFGGSDIDLGIYFNDISLDNHELLTITERVAVLRDAWELLSAHFELVELVDHARVPILKLIDRSNGVACDLCIGSSHVILNTAMLKYYGEIDPRVRPLMLAIKYWAKERGVCDAVNGTLSSYGYALLVLFYLQAEANLLSPVMTVFDSIETNTTISCLLKQLKSLPRVDVAATFGSFDADSVGALLHGFFHFYAVEFDMERNVVSVGQGHVLVKREHWPHPVDWRLSIEDPFEHTHDVGRVVFSRVGHAWITRELQRAYTLLSTGSRLEDVMTKDETAWNWHATCYLCDSSDHKARQCAHATFGNNRSGNGSYTTPTMTECWYCGGVGHIKATCPLHAYLHVPQGVTGSCYTDTTWPVSTCMPMTVVPPILTMPCSPLVTSIATTNTPPRASPRKKKKKRPRFGSISSLASSPEQDHARKYMVAASRRCRAKRRLMTSESPTGSNSNGV